MVMALKHTRFGLMDGCVVLACGVRKTNSVSVCCLHRSQWRDVVTDWVPWLSTKSQLQSKPSGVLLLAFVCGFVPAGAIV